MNVSASKFSPEVLERFERSVIVIDLKDTRVDDMGSHPERTKSYQYHGCGDAILAVNAECEPVELSYYDNDVGRLLNTPGVYAVFVGVASCWEFVKTDRVVGR